MPLNLGSASCPFTELHAVHGCTEITSSRPVLNDPNLTGHKNRPTSHPSSASSSPYITPVDAPISPTMSTYLSPPSSPPLRFPKLGRASPDQAQYSFLTNRSEFLALRRQVSTDALSSARSASYYDFLQSVTPASNTCQLDWINARAAELKALKTRRSFARWLDKQYQTLHGEDLLAFSDVLSEEDTPEPPPCTAPRAAPSAPPPKPGTGAAYVITDIITLMAAQAAVVVLVVGLWWCVFADSTDVAYVRSILAVLKAMLTDKRETK
ncbi:hypothetical protein KL911_001147 [Ogataea haglerorum]|uniref:uncharacterized protein n=1 Tax=Ogataea haglerorum TaxID=1937702 RepID=UPI001C8B023A|nr:uncharacterized protein KL911_001147 [Ogataea haglerorum]KAG7756345.1 hypothetical protein KL911_001147 [Ogataea haglerorum]